MSDTSYIERQRFRDEEYSLAWKALTPTQRASIARAGVKGPDLGDTQSDDVCRDGDAASLFENSLSTAVNVDFAEKADRLPDLLAEAFSLSAEQASAIALWHAGQVRKEVQVETSLQLNRIIGFFLMPGNVLVRAHALAHAARMASLSGLRSLRHSAEICGVSVEGVRKVAWRWVEILGLQPLEGSKSPEAREKYASDKRTNHWRKQKCKMEKLQASQE